MGDIPGNSQHSKFLRTPQIPKLGELCALRNAGRNFHPLALQPGAPTAPSWKNRAGKELREARTTQKKTGKKPPNFPDKHKPAHPSTRGMCFAFSSDLRFICAPFASRARPRSEKTKSGSCQGVCIQTFLRMGTSLVFRGNSLPR